VGSIPTRPTVATLVLGLFCLLYASGADLARFGADWYIYSPHCYEDLFPAAHSTTSLRSTQKRSLNTRRWWKRTRANSSEILHKVIQDGLSDDTSPRERLAIYKTLDELTGKLRNALQVERESAKAPHEFLKQGPVARLQKSRLTSSQTTTVTIESEG
jgi:hypothetical protein